MKLICLLLIAVSVYAFSKAEIKEYAAKFTHHPSTITAMCGVESSYGKNLLGDDGRSLGYMQVQVPTALFVAKKYKSLSWLLRVPRKSLHNLLLHNHGLNIEIACKYFEYNRLKHGYVRAVMKHNGVRKGCYNWTYYNKVRRMMK